jgi:hypothetical protein
MQRVSCGTCHNQVPFNSTISIDDVPYCEECLESKFPNDESLKGKKVIKEFDPTVCSTCRHDNGENALPKLDIYPLCMPCHQRVKTRVFPSWVKGFLVGIILLVFFSLIWNYRFINAYTQLRAARTAVEQGKLDVAGVEFQKAAANIPELDDLQSLGNYYRGVSLLYSDKNEEALSLFQNCRNLPQDYTVDAYKAQAEIGVAFDKKDYFSFLLASQRFLTFDSSAQSLAQVASAYSCLYAERKIDSLRTLSYQYLAKARIKGDTAKDFAFYSRLIEYRLATSENLTRNEYAAKFPNGWTQN